LGIPVNDTSCFHITLEDFLQSIPPMISEIVRLAINRVPSKDYHFVTSTCTFVKEMYSNLQILNLRNDSLRRKVDGVKYELKRIEEVVFHLSMRNLI
ncbi:Translin, partial [Rozella allomycis CSF55]